MINLLSFRKTLTQTEVQKEMNDIYSFIKEMEPDWIFKGEGDQALLL